MSPALRRENQLGIRGTGAEVWRSWLQVSGTGLGDRDRDGLSMLGHHLGQLGDRGGPVPWGRHGRGAEGHVAREVTGQGSAGRDILRPSYLVAASVPGGQLEAAVLPGVPAQVRGHPDTVALHHEGPLGLFACKTAKLPGRHRPGDVTSKPGDSGTVPRALDGQEVRSEAERR